MNFNNDSLSLSLPLSLFLSFSFSILFFEIRAKCNIFNLKILFEKKCYFTNLSITTENIICYL